MIAVFYDASGRILSTVRASETALKAQGKPYLEVTEQRDDYDVTHCVIDDKLVSRDHG